jgi:amidohydrolase
LNQSELTYLRNLRRQLHARPELSGEEHQTAERIARELEKTNPDRLVTGLGGNGIAAMYGPGTGGPKMMVRAELDGLPIEDRSGAKHRSQNKGISHTCGHDGHMAVMVGVARHLGQNRPDSGEVAVLFQPSEETGEGAGRMLEDPGFDQIQFDRAYAFHNLPGFEENWLLIKEGVFASASVGLICRLEGESSHAAYPQQGSSPAPVMAEMIRHLQKAGEPDISSPSYAIGTITYAKLGERAFGITPGQAEMGITLRAAGDELLKELRDNVIGLLRELSKASGIEASVEEIEPFKATVNSKKGSGNVLKAARAAGMQVQMLDHPFPWSEDFGRFSEKSEVCLFGIGAGEDHPHLHAGSYDFNDNLIRPAVNLLIQILKTEWE